MMKKQLLFLVVMLLPLVANADRSGTCGNNLAWTYIEATQTLTISGWGAMKDYSNVNTPWYSFRENIKSVILEDGVMSIGYGAFSSCSGLTSINIPNSVRDIWSYAFYGCSSLISVTIPNSVMDICSSAFYGCSSPNYNQ